MIKQKIIEIYTIMVPYLALLSEKIRQVFQTIKNTLKNKITSWWQVILVLSFAIVFLYYPIGGWMIHDIDTSSHYRPQTKENQLASLDIISHLINREVHHKLWTPNLPFLFPSYFLDDMPNFQLGIMSSIAKTVEVINRIPIISTSEDSISNLSEAAELLQYPGNIWLFSPQNNLLPVPSSNTQYKKGRKKLNNFNDKLSLDKAIFPRTSQNLAIILKTIKKDLSKLVLHTDNHIRENQNIYNDFKADDTFYYAQGKLYAYFQIIKALGVDFKNILITHDIYQQWTAALKSLELASDLNPLIIRNGKINSSFSPNHLITINYFAVKTINQINNVLNKLNKPMDLPQ